MVMKDKKNVWRSCPKVESGSTNITPDVSEGGACFFGCNKSCHRRTSVALKQFELIDIVTELRLNSNFDLLNFVRLPDTRN